MAFVDELCMIKHQETLDSVAPQIELVGRVCFMFSTPSLEDTHWTDGLEKRKPGMILDVSETLVCTKCDIDENSIAKKIACPHKKMSNPLKSKKHRRKLAEIDDPMELEMRLREDAGWKKKKTTAFYKLSSIDGIFAGFELITYSYDEVDYFFILIDPNAGGNCRTGIIGGVKTLPNRSHRGGRIILLYIDNAETRELELFYDAIVERAIGTMHRVFRKGKLDYWIVVFCESQKAWDGDTINERIQRKTAYGDKNYENIHIFKDEQKNRKTNQRHGVNVSADRQNKMVEFMSQLLKDGGLKFGKDAVTTNEYGLDIMKKIFRNQMINFFHYDENKNSGYISGKPVKNNTGKKNGQQDDIADSVHMLWWLNYIEVERDNIIFYDQQIKMFSNQLVYG